MHPPSPEFQVLRGGTPSKKRVQKTSRSGSYETSPPAETASDLADFYQRQGHALCFAGKGRENSAWFAPNGTIGGRSARRAAGKLVGGRRLDPIPRQGGAMTPPSKTRTPPLAPLVFPAIGAAHVHRTVHFSPSFFDAPLPVRPPPLCVTGPRKNSSFGPRARRSFLRTALSEPVDHCCGAHRRPARRRTAMRRRARRRWRVRQGRRE
jgi:hypothetical protein